MNAEIQKQLKSDFDAGFAAYTKGVSKYENPHEPGSLNFDSWNYGWIAASEFNN